MEGLGFIIDVFPFSNDRPKRLEMTWMEGGGGQVGGRGGRGERASPRLLASPALHT